ncbi:MAG: hypothetical protein N2C12_06265 [Planctomycetales bacterium]
MGRTDAGTLGLLAFVTVVTRALRHGAAVETTLLTASLCLFGFTLIGYVLGAMAQWIVEDSVQTQVTAELTAQEAANPKAGELRAT